MSDLEKLKKRLEERTCNLFERGGGSVDVNLFFDAKAECIRAGISEDEVESIVQAATEGAKRK